jgi:hypothetical protein
MMRRQQTCETLAANSPTTIDQHSSLASKAREKIGRGLFRADDSRGRHCFLDSNVYDLILIQRLTDGKVFYPRARLGIRGSDASHASARAMNRDVRQFLLLLLLRHRYC